MRFSLQSLLLAFVVIWSSLAAFGPGGILIAALLIGGVAYLRAAKSGRQTVERIVILLVIGLCLLCLWLPAMSARISSGRLSCQNNLQQIGLALLGYHDDYGCFPPAYIPDDTGKPMHSWRVLLLPHLGRKDLYEQYDFDEPWDGPNNSALAAANPSYYLCPSDPSSSQPGATSYLAVVGSRAAWAGGKPRKLGDFADGPGPTILVVEVANSGINWMEPRDLSFDRARAGVNRKSPGGISCPHWRSGLFSYDDTGANVLCADGSVRFLTDDIPSATLEALLTIDDGEAIDRNRIPGMAPDPNWTRIIGLVVLALSVALLLFRPKKRDQV